MIECRTNTDKLSKKSMPMLSVIIPTYNRLAFLKVAINSVLKQSYQDFELIIIDDGSTDGTSEYSQLLIANNGPKVRYAYQDRKGVSAARNHGFRLAQGEYICFLDSDDQWHKTKLEKQLGVFLANPNQVACYTDERWILNGKHFNQHKKHQKSGGWIFDRAVKLCIISPSSIMLKRAVFDELGMFDESFVVCEDYEYWLRLTSNYPVFFIAEQLIIKYGGHNDQLSKTYWGMDRFRIRALEKLILAGSLSAEQTKLALAELSHKYHILQLGARKRKRYLYWLQIILSNYFFTIKLRGCKS